MQTAPGPSASSIMLLLRVVEDHVERAAVVGDARDGLLHLVLRRQQQRRVASRSFEPAAAAAAIGARWGRCCGPRAAPRAAGRPRPAARPRAARRRRSTRGSSRPPLGDDRGLAADARQRAEDDVELRVDRLARRARAGAGARPRRPRARRPASPGRPRCARGCGGHRSARRPAPRRRRRASSDGQGCEQLGAHAPPNPSVSAFM